MTVFTHREDEIILLDQCDDRTLADLLFMPVAMVRDRRRELTQPPKLPYVRRRPPPKLAKFRFTEDERNQLLGLCDKGLPVREIARRLDRSPRSVRRIRNAAAGS